MDSATRNDRDYVRLRLTFVSGQETTGVQRKCLYGFERRRLATVEDVIADVALKFGLSRQNLQFSVEDYAIPSWCSSKVLTFDEEVDVSVVSSSENGQHVKAFGEYDNNKSEIQGVTSEVKTKEHKSTNVHYLAVEDEALGFVKVIKTKKRRHHNDDDDDTLKIKETAFPTSTPMSSMNNGLASEGEGSVCTAFTESSPGAAIKAKKARKHKTAKEKSDDFHGASESQVLADADMSSASLSVVVAPATSKNVLYEGPQKPDSIVNITRKKKSKKFRRRQNAQVREVSSVLNRLHEGQIETAAETPSSISTVVDTAQSKFENLPSPQGTETSKKSAGSGGGGGHIHFKSSSSSSESEAESSGGPSSMAVSHVVRCSPDFKPKVSDENAYS
ncbi:unnamed protein product [Soboliphyme baturini]|uniref:Coilin n=1 Tax=Soboliphyme baturini TaxID=241478 RepID=A0A183IQH3_9BILA|nr:unnamed protein product [Soboliphyme baturini]